MLVFDVMEYLVTNCKTTWRMKDEWNRRTKWKPQKIKGIKNQLLINKIILRNCKRRLNRLGMTWIDYKKAYDMIPTVGRRNV